MASRKIEDMHPALQPLVRQFLQECDKAGLDVLITCTYRSGAEQDQLYAQGRTKPGPIVTRARAGQSKHNHTLNGKPASLAFDVVPMIDGKPMWSSKHPAWQAIGKIGQSVGFKWYGAPGSSFREFPHFEKVV